MWLTAAGCTLVGCSSLRVVSQGAAASGAVPEPPLALMETAAAAHTPLTLAALVNSACQHNPEILTLRGAVEAARAEAITVTGLRNPELRMEYGEGSRYTGRTWYQPSGAANGGGVDWRPAADVRKRESESDVVRLGLRLFPPNPWLLRAQGAGARARFAAATADLRAAEWRLECAIGRLLSEIRTLRRELRIACQQAEVRREYTAAVIARLQHNQGSALDQLDARQRHLRATEDVAVIEELLREKLQAVFDLSGASLEGEAAEIEGEPEVPLTALAGLEFRWMESRQEVVAAYWRHQGAMATLREAKARRIPWLSHVQGSYGRGTTGEEKDAIAALSGAPSGLTPDSQIAVDDSEDEEWSIEAAVEIPVFSFYGGATRMERTEVARCAQVLRATLRRAGAEFGNARFLWLNARERTKECQAGLADVENQAEHLGRQMEEAGLLGPEEQLAVTEMKLQAQRAALQARRSESLAFWRFREACGERIEALAGMEPR